jgi:cyclomaltodextrinase / maltogenic alpha-amylase / neopullulanase
MSEVAAGQKYRHFKGGEYEVIAVARDCENPDRRLVIYKSLYVGDEFPLGTIWSRLLGDFVGDKVFEDGRRVKRFELLS